MGLWGDQKMVGPGRRACWSGRTKGDWEKVVAHLPVMAWPLVWKAAHSKAKSPFPVRLVEQGFCG